MKANRRMHESLGSRTYDVAGIVHDIKVRARKFQRYWGKYLEDNDLEDKVGEYEMRPSPRQRSYRHIYMAKAFGDWYGSAYKQKDPRKDGRTFTMGRYRVAPGMTAVVKLRCDLMTETVASFYVRSLDPAKGVGEIIVNFAYAMAFDEPKLRRTIAHEVRHFEDCLKCWLKISDVQQLLGTELSLLCNATSTQEYSYTSTSFKLFSYFCDKAEIAAYLQEAHEYLKDIASADHYSVFEMLRRLDKHGIEVAGVGQLCRVENTAWMRRDASIPAILYGVVRDEYLTIASYLQHERTFAARYGAAVEAASASDCLHFLFTIASQYFSEKTVANLRKEIVWFCNREMDKIDADEVVDKMDEALLKAVHTIMQDEGIVGGLYDKFKEVIGRLMRKLSADAYNQLSDMPEDLREKLDGQIKAFPEQQRRMRAFCDKLKSGELDDLDDL